MSSHATVKLDVANYYTAKLELHGPCPQGVDWNSEKSQLLRFEQLCRVIPAGTRLGSLLDYGCGYGALLPYLSAQHPGLQYTGFDIAPAMIAAARKLYPTASAQWRGSLETEEQFDYVVASGIFNVKMERSDSEWQAYILDTINELNRRARRGFSFNILTSYSDAELMQAQLFYADPDWLFGYCKRHCSRFVALLHDYPLYEFTIIVRKDV